MQYDCIVSNTNISSAHMDSVTDVGPDVCFEGGSVISVGIAISKVGKACGPQPPKLR